MEIERRRKFRAGFSKNQLNEYEINMSEVEFGEMEDPCSNCDDIDLHLDEICPECGRDQHSD